MNDGVMRITLTLLATVRRLRWPGLLAGGLVGWGVVQVLPDAGPMTTATSVGFMLCAILGGCLLTCWWMADGHIDDHEQRLTNLEILIAGWLPEEVEELEPAAYEPEPEWQPAEVEVAPLDAEPITDEIPVVQPETVPMERAWDESVAELAPEPAPVGGWQDEQDAWLEQELARLDEFAKEEAQ